MRTIQIVTACDYAGGSLEYALSLARVLRTLCDRVRVVDVTPPTPFAILKYLAGLGVEHAEAAPDLIPNADISLVIDLYREECCRAAVCVGQDRTRLILVQTGYLKHPPLANFDGTAEALWFVSWDQAVDSRGHWGLAHQVQVVHCAVDTDTFRPMARPSIGHPWILCRHSRDTPEKFSHDIFLILNRLGDTHDVVFRILGGTETLRHVSDERVSILAQGLVEPKRFLQDADLWFFSHAPCWRESACIAMLEAMACGLPVLVTNAGGMREYLEHGLTGFLCSDAEEFIRYGCLLLDRPDLYRMMAHNARHFIEEKHSLRVLTQRVADLLGLKPR